jgi:hypothetical protein
MTAAEVWGWAYFVLFVAFAAFTVAGVLGVFALGWLDYLRGRLREWLGVR